MICSGDPSTEQPKGEEKDKYIVVFYYLIYARPQFDISASALANVFDLLLKKRQIKMII